MRHLRGFKAKRDGICWGEPVKPAAIAGNNIAMNIMLFGVQCANFIPNVLGGNVNAAGAAFRVAGYQSTMLIIDIFRIGVNPPGITTRLKNVSITTQVVTTYLLITHAGGFRHQLIIVKQRHHLILKLVNAFVYL